MNHRELYRQFLIEDLPEPLTRASEHLQIFDNYITNTRMRMRSIRIPHSNEWKRMLQQRIPPEETGRGWLFNEMPLNEEEYAQFQIFEGNETRKNRYACEIDGRRWVMDVFLGNLWGLNIAITEFEDEEQMREFSPPAFVFMDVTEDSFFRGDVLAEKKFEDVREWVEKRLAETAV